MLAAMVSSQFVEQSNDSPRFQETQEPHPAEEDQDLKICVQIQYLIHRNITYQPKWSRLICDISTIMIFCLYNLNCI